MFTIVLEGIAPGSIPGGKEVLLQTVVVVVVVFFLKSFFDLWMFFCWVDLYWIHISVRVETPIEFPVFIRDSHQPKSSCLYIIYYTYIYIYL